MSTKAPAFRSNLVPSLAEDVDTTGGIRVADIVVTDDALGSESLSLSGAERPASRLWASNCD